jgi:alcohol dehydrogenase class IV
VKKYKKSFRDERLVAKIVIVDPALTLNLPQKETAYGGMDAICQLIESFVSKKKNIYSQAFSSFFIPKALIEILNAYKNPLDINARSIMSASSLASGIALANSGLGAVHGFASGMGGMFDIPHGLICAVLLPGIVEKNSRVLKDEYLKLAELINTDKSQDINKMIDTLYNINSFLDIPVNFKEFNIDKNLADEIVKRSNGSSMSGNPADFHDNEWVNFITKYL